MTEAPSIYPYSIVLTPPAWAISLMPHDSIPSTNPMFRIDSRHVPNSKILQQKMLRRMGVIVGGCVGIWLIGAIAMLASGPSRRADIYGSLSQIIMLMFWGSFLDKFILDFVGIFSGLNLIREEVTQNRWDLISLTPLRTDHIVTSKHALAQINAWNTLTLVMGLRLAVAILMLLHIFLFPMAFPARNSSYLFLGSFSLLNDFRLLLIFIGSLASFTIMSFIYVIEPRWRLRALTAGGLALSSNKGDVSLSIIAGLWVFVQVWFSQILMAFGAFLLLATGGSIFFALSSLAAIGGMLYVSAVGIIIYIAYNQLAIRWLNKAWRELRKRRGTP